MENTESENFEVLVNKILELLKGEQNSVAKRAIKEAQELLDYRSVVN